MIRLWFESMDSAFSISRDIRKTAEKHWNMNTPVFYLGVDVPAVRTIGKKCIESVIWIGSIIQRKRPELLLEVAKAFPELSFTMIGDGDMQNQISEKIHEDSLTNVKMTGRLSNSEVYQCLQSADLLLMTSDKEGLPKVIGEAMAMEVPVIYINQYYDVDYVASSSNGYAVQNVEEMKRRIRELLDDAGRYQKMSSEAANSIKPYLWKNLIGQYEMYFEEVYQK